jgi:hypothetical protein
MALGPANLRFAPRVSKPGQTESWTGLNRLLAGSTPVSATMFSWSYRQQGSTGQHAQGARRKTPPCRAPSLAALTAIFSRKFLRVGGHVRREESMKAWQGAKLFPQRDLGPASVAEHLQVGLWG